MKFLNIAVGVAALITPLANAQSENLVTLENDQLLVASGTENNIEIVDGDTLWVGNHEIRLFGIEALESNQSCNIDNHPKSYCHKGASNLLETYAKHPDFKCEFETKDGENRPWIRYGRYIATCYVGSTNVNQELVRNGWAYADEKYGDGYRKDQEYAEVNVLGIHGTTHLKPADWRKQKRGDSCSCK